MKVGRLTSTVALMNCVALRRECGSRACVNAGGRSGLRAHSWMGTTELEQVSKTGCKYTADGRLGKARHDRCEEEGLYVWYDTWLGAERRSRCWLLLPVG